MPKKELKLPRSSNDCYYVRVAVAAFKWKSVLGAILLIVVLSTINAGSALAKTKPEPALVVPSLDDLVRQSKQKEQEKFNAKVEAELVECKQAIRHYFRIDYRNRRIQVSIYRKANYDYLPFPYGIAVLTEVQRRAANDGWQVEYLPCTDGMNDPDDWAVYVKPAEKVQSLSGITASTCEPAQATHYLPSLEEMVQFDCQREVHDRPLAVQRLVGLATEAMSTFSIAEPMRPLHVRNVSLWGELLPGGWRVQYIQEAKRVIESSSDWQVIVKEHIEKASLQLSDPDSISWDIFVKPAREIGPQLPR